jgi:hypothetical protein
MSSPDAIKSILHQSGMVKKKIEEQHQIKVLTC